MRFQDLIYDGCVALLTMLGLSIVSGPIFCLIYNGIILSHLPSGFSSLGLLDSIVLIFGLNVCGFFRLQKRDILIAQPEFSEGEENP